MYSLLTKGQVHVELQEENRYLSQFELNEEFDPIVYGLPATQHYFTLISIGTPPQQLNVTFDTFAEDSWLITENCNSCNFSTKFQTDMSKTYHKTDRRYFTQVLF